MVAFALLCACLVAVAFGCLVIVNNQVDDLAHGTFQAAARVPYQMPRGVAFANWPHEPKPAKLSGPVSLRGISSFAR